MLRLAEALPDSFVLYNGPRCGASAPDHMHFQACSRELFPIEQDSRGVTGPSFPDYGRRVFILRGRSLSQLADRLQALMDILEEVTRSDGEPMVNIAAYYDDGQWTTFVFPRGKHRPRAYETGERTVSPATIDLCGVLVVPVEKDFVQIRGAEIESIFEEVTLEKKEFDIALDRLAL
jgi:hypothetical protein